MKSSTTPTSIATRNGENRPFAGVYGILRQSERAWIAAFLRATRDAGVAGSDVPRHKACRDVHVTASTGVLRSAIPAPLARIPVMAGHYSGEHLYAPLVLRS